MQCPRCQSTMKQMSHNGINIDVCYDSCGGIWFDWLELKKLDEKHEVSPEFVEELSKSATKKIDLAERIDCPTCDNMVMARRFHSTERKVEMDECSKCGGMWLDAGELTDIHSTFDTEEDRIKAANEFFKNNFGEDMEDLRAEEQEKQAFARKFRHALRFICPSYYFTGR